MRPVRHLGRLSESVDLRLTRIENLVAPLHSPADFSQDGVAAFAVIELDNIWSSFVRNYYLSWFLRPRTTAGVRISNGAVAIMNTPFDAALKLASKILYGKTQRGKTGRIEPAWHEKRVLYALSRGCGSTHMSQIQQAMSIQSTVFDYLHTVRNFYAHRCEETANKLPRVARAFGLAPVRQASKIVLAVPPSSSGTIILDWIAEVRATTEMLCA